VKRILEQLLDQVDQATNELVELHQALVRIPTVNTGELDSGNEIEVCRLLEDRFQQEGIQSKTFESAPSRGNLLASVGAGAGPRLLLVSHTDVVPADETRWAFPPFCGDVVDGRVRGRGSDDCKALVASEAMALILLNRADVSLDGELLFLAAAGEETGGDLGVGWLAANHPDQIRADWAVNEGGGLPLNTRGEGVNYLMTVGEKGRVEATFKMNGRSGHAAIPWASDNALFKLSQVLERIRTSPHVIDVSLPVFEPLKLFGIDEEPSCENIDDLLGRLDEIDPEMATQLKALSRMTIAPTEASGGLRANSVPGLARLLCDVRQLPHHDMAFVQGELEKLIEGIEGVELEMVSSSVPSASPFDHSFIDVMREATAVALGRDDVSLISGLTKGGTDSGWIRPLGTPAFGFAPMHPDLDTSRKGVHGVNESYAIENVVLLTKFQIVLACLALGVK